MQKLASIVRLSCLMIMLVVSPGCQRTPPSPEPAEKAKPAPASKSPRQTGSIDDGPAYTGVLRSQAQSPAGCGDDGLFSAKLYGAVAGRIEWDSADMSCEGMPRPRGRGARLRFAGEAGQDKLSIAVLISLPGLKRGAVAKELASNVTVIEEGNGRFFSTGDLDDCWTDVSAQTPIDGSRNRYVIGGTLFCIAPLREINGDSSVSVEELHFTGLLDWSAK